MANNSTGHLTYEKRSTYAIVVPNLLCMCCLGLIINAIVLVAAGRISRPKSPVLVITISLAAADAWFSLSLAAGFLVHSYLPIVVHVRYELQACVGYIVEAMRLGGIITTILHILLLSSAHFISLKWPVFYSNQMGPGVLKPILAAIWLFPPAGFATAFASIPGKGMRTPRCDDRVTFDHFYFRLAVVLLVAVPFFVICAVYTLMALFLKRQFARPLGQGTNRRLISEDKSGETPNQGETPTNTLGEEDNGAIPSTSNQLVLPSRGMSAASMSGTSGVTDTDSSNSPHKASLGSQWKARPVLEHKRTTSFTQAPKSAIVAASSPVAAAVASRCRKVSLALTRIQAQTSRRQRQSRFMTTIILILASFAISWFPNCLIYVLTCSSCPIEVKDSSLLLNFGIASNILMIAKGIVNPLLYAIRIPELRGSFRQATQLGGFSNGASKRHSTIRRGRRRNHEIKQNQMPKLRKFTAWFSTGKTSPRSTLSTYFTEPNKHESCENGQLCIIETAI